MGGVLGRIGTHPTVDLELLRMSGLLSGDGLRASCRGDERPDRTGYQEGRWGL